MPLLAGHRVGPYEILSSLGAGGMGEVYRAVDTKLGRHVAIKILPAAWTMDRERLARFDREARVLATLNHPQIGAIYGLEEGSTPGSPPRALVLELVEGDTLAERVGRTASTTGGGLPQADALDIARQIADALDAAHEKGIVHRDLKPANIKITADGLIKILDFGLATVHAGGSDPDGSSSATLSHLTHDGAFLGTPAYMSPEQVRGKSVDKRTDVWAFGCILYELLTGRVAFDGETISDVIVAVLERDPDWSRLPATTPGGVLRLLRRCLTRDARRRLRDIGDVRLDLAEPAADDFDAGRSTAAPTAVRQVTFRRLTDFVGMNEAPAISPDGKMVAFVALSEGRRQIWILLLAGGAPLQITRDDADHEEPRWAPDSSTLLYYTPAPKPDEEGTLWEVPALGGAPRPIVSALGGGDVSHTGDRIAVFQDRHGRVELVTVARDGSDAQLVAPALEANACGSPRWSPDDRWLAFQGNLAHFDGRLFVVSTSGGDPRTIAQAGSIKGLSWLPDGSGLVYSSSAGSTVPYPPTFNLRLIGRDGAGDRAITYGDVSHIEPDAHRSGTLVVCRVRTESDIWRFPVDGLPAENTRNGVRVTHQSGQVQTPSVSPDGREMVYLSDNGGHGNLWISRTDGTGIHQLTFERDPAVIIGVPLWSPAGGQIAFIVNRGHFEVWLINPDGRGLRQVIPRGSTASWSLDGEWIYYVHDNPPSRLDKVSVRDGTVVRVRDDGQLHAPVTDGSTLYFAARRSHHAGSWDWEIRSASPDAGPSVLLAEIPGARLPVSPLFVHTKLSPDGRWLVLPLRDGGTTNIWALPAEGGPMRPLTDFGERPTVIARQVSWSPDSRFLFAAVAETRGDVVVLDGLLS